MDTRIFQLRGVVEDGFVALLRSDGLAFAKLPISEVETTASGDDARWREFFLRTRKDVRRLKKYGRTGPWDEKLHNLTKSWNTRARWRGQPTRGVNGYRGGGVWDAAFTQMKQQFSLRTKRVRDQLRDPWLKWSETASRNWNKKHSGASE